MLFRSWRAGETTTLSFYAILIEGASDSETWSQLSSAACDLRFYKADSYAENYAHSELLSNVRLQAQYFGFPHHTLIVD